MKAGEVKLATIEAADDELAASLEALAELGARLGAPFHLAAARIRQALSATAAARLRRRNAVLIELRRRWYGESSNNKAAKVMAAELMRYECAAWRWDAKLSAPPPAAIGTWRELAWWALKEGDGSAPGPSRLRRIFDDAPNWQHSPLPIAKRTGVLLGLDSRGQENALNAEPSFETVVRRVPEFQAAVASALKADVAERQAHLEAIAKLDAAAAKAWIRQETRKAESLAKEQDAHRAFKATADEHQRVLGAVASERGAYERERNAHEAALVAGEWPEIDDFYDTCEREIARAKAAVATRGTIVNGKHHIVGNRTSIGVRMSAITASMRAAPELRLIADRRQLPAAIAKIIASWPLVQEPGEPNAGAA